MAKHYFPDFVCKVLTKRKALSFKYVTYFYKDIQLLKFETFS